jgi:hypothetical protein
LLGFSFGNDASSKANDNVKVQNVPGEDKAKTVDVSDKK